MTLNHNTTKMKKKIDNLKQKISTLTDAKNESQQNHSDLALKRILIV